MNENDLQHFRGIWFWIASWMLCLFLIVLLILTIKTGISNINYMKNHEKLFNYIEDYSKENDIEEDVINTFKIKEICSDNNDWEVNEELCFDRINAFLACNKWAKYERVWKYLYLTTDKRITITHEETIELANKIQSKEESQKIINKCNELLSKDNLFDEIQNRK